MKNKKKKFDQVKITNEPKVDLRKTFYAVIDYIITDPSGERFLTSGVITYHGTRLEAKHELAKIAKQLDGTITHFGAFKN